MMITSAVKNLQVIDMPKKLTVYQKPTCSKCRDLMKTLRERGVAFDSVNYYEQPFDVDGLKKILARLKMRPIDLMRKNEQIYKDLQIGKVERTEDELVGLMVENPDLIQRPIVIQGNKAVLARPIENLEKLDE